MCWTRDTQVAFQESGSSENEQQREAVSDMAAHLSTTRPIDTTQVAYDPVLESGKGHRCRYSGTGPASFFWYRNGVSTKAGKVEICIERASCCCCYYG